MSSRTKIAGCDTVATFVNALMWLSKDYYYKIPLILQFQTQRMCGVLLTAVGRNHLVLPLFDIEKC